MAAIMMVGSGGVAGGARAALTWLPTTPNRGVLAVRPSEPSDRWWLRHELRSRSRDLPKIAQGRQAREISRRALSHLELRWSDPEVRQRFQEVVEPLHGRAVLALEENQLLKELLDRVLRDVSSIAVRSTPVSQGEVPGVVCARPNRPHLDRCLRPLRWLLEAGEILLVLGFPDQLDVLGTVGVTPGGAKEKVAAAIDKAAKNLVTVKDRRAATDLASAPFRRYLRTRIFRRPE
ncbi:hypothetical protein [Spirillospora sp. NPDC048819]|uniref:hypothetical protein n=1 Tax=Spirillospora sp. NPDC048819 TaxID=3155268 RepID=UPI0034014C6F